jgi:hypothetical protein
MVLQTLPNEVAFLVYPNQSFDGNPRVADEVVYPEESLSDLDQYLGPWLSKQVVAYLWRDGKVPEWIDASVVAEDGVRTLVGLLCCGRYTATEALLYHHRGGLAPFSLKSPELPIGWQSAEVSERFDLYWRRPRMASRPWWKVW